MWPFHLHKYDRRERVNGILELHCDCGKSVPALSRSRQEIKAMKRKFPQPKVRTAHSQRKPVPFKVAK